MNTMIEPTELAKGEIEIKVNDISIKAIESVFHVEMSKRPAKMVESFKTALMTELSQAWVREQELKEQVDQLKKQIC